MMDWLQLLLPAWIMGSLLVFLTAPLGCLMLWRRMSFFADTMAHGTLLGVAIAGALSLPLWMGVTFLALLLVGVLWILHDPRLPNDALLALCSATLLCSGLLFIQHIPSLRPELLSYLFGDLLTISWADLPVFAALQTYFKHTVWQSVVLINITAVLLIAIHAMFYLQTIDWNAVSEGQQQLSLLQQVIHSDMALLIVYMLPLLVVMLIAAIKNIDTHERKTKPSF